MYLQNGIYNEWTRQYTIDIWVIANMKYVFSVLASHFSLSETIYSGPKSNKTIVTR